MEVSSPSTAEPTRGGMRKEVEGVTPVDHMLQLATLHKIAQQVFEDIQKLRKEDKDILRATPMSRVLLSRRVDEAIAQSCPGSHGNMAICTGEQSESSAMSHDDVLSVSEITTIERLIAAAGPEDGVSALQDFLQLFEVNADSGFRHIMVVQVFLQSGGLSFLQKCISPPFHLVAIGSHILRFIGACSLEVQTRTIVSFGEIASLMVKTIRSDDSGYTFAALRYYVHIPLFQNILLSHGKIPIISGYLLKHIHSPVFHGNDRDVLRMLAASDNADIHQQLVACSVSRLDAIANTILHSKCSAQVWADCCDEMAVHRKAAFTAGVTVVTGDATSAAMAPAATDAGVSMDTLYASSVATDTGVKSHGPDVANACDLRAAAVLSSCLQEMTGRFFTPFDGQWDVQFFESAILSYISTFELNHGVQFLIELAIIFSQSSISVCRKYTMPMAEALLGSACGNEVPLFTTLPEWALLRERIATWISSQNSQLAGKARLFVSRHSLGPPTLLNLCLQCVSEGILDKKLKSRLHFLPPSLLRRLTPTRVQ